MASTFRSLKNVVLVDGCRLPFHPSGTKYNKLVAYDLARLALTGILNNWRGRVHSSLSSAAVRNLAALREPQREHCSLRLLAA